MKFVRALQMLSMAAAARAFTVEQVDVPATEDEKHGNFGTASITVGTDKYDTEYKVIYRSGDVVDGVTFGAVLDQNGNQIMAYPMDASYVEIPFGNVPGEEPLISHVADFTSLIATPDNKNTPTDFAMFAHFESPLPAQIYRINVDFNDDCTLEGDSIEATNWTEWGGLWEPCSGKVTPWNTHLGSEEHEPDAKIMEGMYEKFEEKIKAGNVHATNIQHFMRYYGFYSENVTDQAGWLELKKVFNPYKFGHVTELSVDEATGETKTQKWYTTGRVSIENPEIMPDNKTIYIADDANYGILTRFVMDLPGDMSAGTLYAANWTQADSGVVATSKQAAGEETTTTAGGNFAIDWIKLGHATQQEIYDLIWGNSTSEPLTFDDIFEFEELDKGACKENFTQITNGWAGPEEECLKLKEGMEQAAAFLETRRYANILGATAEMQSTEGLASVPKDSKFYLSMSAIKNGMSDEEGSISVPENKCGCVYEFDVDDEQVLTSARALICGEPDETDPDNACSTASIANPDNLAYTGLFGTEDDHSLLIAEDTSNHQNDYLWHYDLATGMMDRILTTGYGTQVTGPAYFSDGQGCYLLMAVVPHPYKKSDQDKVDVENINNEGLGGYVGYIGPIGSRNEL